MDVDNLHRFLVEIQKERNATVEDAHNIINNFGHHFFHRKGLNLELFFKYLFGDTNPPTNPNIGVITFTFFFFPLKKFSMYMLKHRLFFILMFDFSEDMLSNHSSDS